MKNKIYTIVGKRSSGKSYLATKIIDKYYYDNIKPYIIIIDRSNDYIIDKGLDYLSHVKLGRELEGKKVNWTTLIEREKYVLFEFVDMTEEEEKIKLNNIIKASANIKNVLIVTDECHTFVDKRTAPKEYLRAITGGRHFGLDQIFVCQMVRDMNLKAISQCDVLVSFQEKELNDLKRLSKYLRVSKDKIRNLEDREFLINYDGEIKKMSTNDLNL
jgi:ABC-type dipeptide/oligopeptide/nickel transport system ATPase component